MYSCDKMIIHLPTKVCNRSSAHFLCCRFKKKKASPILVLHLAPAQSSPFISCCGQPSTSFIELPLPSSIPPTASRRYHVKLLSEQLKLHTIPPLLFLTSGDTVTVDLSSPIKEEVSHFSASGCQHSFLS